MLFIKFREPIILDNYQKLVEVLNKNNKKNIMLLSGKRVSKEGFYQELYILLNKLPTFKTLFSPVIAIKTTLFLIFILSLPFLN